jgi:hypothetical protein
MRKTLLLLALFGAALPAFADLGDTYANSVHRYGSRGRVINKTWIEWVITGRNAHTTEIQEQFRNNQAVAIRYYTDWGNTFFDSAIWAQLQANSRRSQNWTEYYVDGNDGAAPGRYFHTDDDKIYARLRNMKAEDGRTFQFMEVAYKSWIERNAGFADETPARPPIEESSEPKVNL